MFPSIAHRYFSYLHQVGKYPLNYITFGQLLEKSATKFGDRKAIISRHQNQSFTYEQVLEKCDRLGAGLTKIGLQKGDRVGLWCPNIIEWFITKYACARAGFILVALNPLYQKPEVEYAVNKVGIKCLICPDKEKRMPFYEILKAIVPDLDKHEPGKLIQSNIPSLKSIVMISEENIKGTYNFQEIAECSDQESIQKIKRNQDCISPDETFSILFSSGTTGKPKAAAVSHFSHVNNPMDIGRRLELDLNYHKICMMAPFFHAMGLTITTGSSVCHGSTIVLTSPTYSPSENLTAITEEKCTMVHGTPTMYIDLIAEQQKRNETLHLEIALAGGSPISPHQLKTMMDVLKLKSVRSLYGLTETTAMVFTSKPGDDEEKSTNTVGCLGSHVEAKVIDQNGKIVPFGTPGELCVRGYQNMIGYWGDKEKTEETLGTDGWLKTGDKFILTEDGYGKIVGRLKDMIIRGGENIFPKEIEDFLIIHPDISEVQVIGLPHERLGEEVCACVKLKENSNMSLKDITDFCKGRLAHFKIPSQLRIVDNFPRTASEKVQKYLLVKEFSENS